MLFSPVVPAVVSPISVLWHCCEIGEGTTLRPFFPATNNCKYGGGYITLFGVGRQERPYHDDSTASRLLSEVKHRRAQLVLRWGTTLEYCVLFFCWERRWWKRGLLPKCTTIPQIVSDRIRIEAAMHCRLYSIRTSWLLLRALVQGFCKQKPSPKLWPDAVAIWNIRAILFCLRPYQPQTHKVPR